MASCSECGAGNSSRRFERSAVDATTPKAVSAAPGLKGGDTALHVAARASSLEAAVALLDCESGRRCVSIKNGEGKLPIECVDNAKSSASAAKAKKIKKLLQEQEQREKQEQKQRAAAGAGTARRDGFAFCRPQRMLTLRSSEERGTRGFVGGIMPAVGIAKAVRARGSDGAQALCDGCLKCRPTAL